MKALRLVEIGKPLQLQEIPAPEPAHGQVLVRVRAAGICHSDAHYCQGRSPTGPLPLSLGHEVAGVVEKTGPGAARLKAGDRVCLHYQVSCGDCYYCAQGQEQFCPQGAMIGKHRDGGYAEYIVVPARNAVSLPPEISFEHGAIMMCSSATAFHALKKARLRGGETVAVFGAGGLGLSALQIARAWGAARVFAVDIRPEKLELASRLGAVPVNAAERDPVEALRVKTDGKGVDVALELIGLPETMRQAVASLAIFGRAALAGITPEPFPLDSYRDLIGREAEVIGVSDHLLSEIPQLLEMGRRGLLDLSGIASRTVPLEAEAVNETLEALKEFRAPPRTVIVP